MSDWLKQITSSGNQEDLLEPAPSMLFKTSSSFPSLATPPILTVKSTPSQKDASIVKKEDLHASENMDALKRLRELPRGTQVESRIAAIRELLGEKEIFNTLKQLRWPQGVSCPRCHSHNVVRRDPPPHAIDKRHYYICLNCKGEGDPSDFDDFTGLPIGTLHSLRQWILCWYLIGFCSIHQIAKVLGLSIAEVLQMATIGSYLANPYQDKLSHAAEKERLNEKQKKLDSETEHLEHSKSKRRSPFKPTPQSKE